MAAWWDVCNQGTQCLPWNPSGGNWGVNGARSDYGVPLPQGTPIVSPVNGVVLPQHPGGLFYSAFGQQSFGGEVDIATNDSAYGGLVNVGVIHMDTASVTPGEVVRKGQFIGTSGGQTSGGHWPSSPLFSSGPHVGLQVHRLGAWSQLLDPGILMQNLWRGRDSSSVPTPQQFQQNGMASVNTALQDASTGQGCDWKTWLACLSGINPAACALCQAQGGANPSGAIGQVAGGAGVAAFSAAFPSLSLYLREPMRILKLVAGGLLLTIGLVLAFLPDIAAGAAAAAGVPEASQALQGASRGNLAHRARQGIVAAGAIQERRTLRRTAARAEERAQRQERREQERQRRESVRRARATVGAPGPAPAIDLSPGARARARARTEAATPREEAPPAMTPGTPEYERRREQFRQMRRTLDE